MPTETKNSTAKASRMGSASEAARRLNSDRPTTMPARNAPSAIDTLNTSEAPTAMPSARTSTVEREQLARVRPRDLVEQAGITRAPTSTVNATRAPTFSTVSSNAQASEVSRAAGPNSAGSSTSTSTVNRSSTTSQPTAMCPAGVCRSL